MPTPDYHHDHAADAALDAVHSPERCANMTLARQMLSHETLVLIIRGDIAGPTGTSTCHTVHIEPQPAPTRSAPGTSSVDVCWKIQRQRLSSWRTGPVRSHWGGRAAPEAGDQRSGIMTAFVPHCSSSRTSSPFSATTVPGMTEARAAGVRLVEQHVLAQTAK